MAQNTDLKVDRPQSLADVIDLIQRHEQVPKSRCRDLVSALRALARFFDLQPAEVPANTRWLRQRLRQFHPKQAGVSEKYLANVKSAVLAALKIVGSDNGHTAWQPKMSVDFQALYDAVPDPQLGYKLSRFFRWCSVQGITPDQLNDSIVEAFETELVDATLQKCPAKVVRNAVLTWNKMKATVDGWPDITLCRAPARIPWTFPLDTFPISFQQEVDAWCDRLAMSDIFDDSAPIRANRPATIKLRRMQIRMMASAIVRSGTPIDQITSLSVLVDLSHFRRGLQVIIDRRDGTVTEATFTLATGIKAIARYFVKVDNAHYEQLKRLCSRLDQQADRYRKTNKDRLSQFDDPRNLARLLTLPDRLIARAKVPGPKPRSASLLMQSAAAIETLLFCPMRIGNLVNLDIDQNLRWVRDGRVQRLFIVIPGEQVKNAKPLYYELTGQSAEIVRYYIEQVRPGLSDVPGTAMFPRLDGKPKAPGDLSHQIKRHIFAETGLTVNAHLFRSLASKIHNAVHAGDASTISHVLGDRIETVMKSYNQFEQKAALETYQSSVNQVRGEKAA